MAFGPLPATPIAETLHEALYGQKSCGIRLPQIAGRKRTLSMTRTLAVWLPRATSPGLAFAIDRVTHDIDVSGGPATRAEAEKRARYLRAELARRDERVAAAWLASLADMVSNPPPREAFAAQARARIVALDLPPLAYTRETLTATALRCKFWPSVAELGEVLLPVVNRVANEARACERIAAPTASEVRPPMTPEERARIEAGFAALQAEMRAAAAAREASSPPRVARVPRQLTRAELVAGYRAAGLPLPPWLADNDAMADQSALP